MVCHGIDSWFLLCRVERGLPPLIAHVKFCKQFRRLADPLDPVIDFGSMRREDCLQLVSRAADLYRRPSLSVKRVSLGLGSHRPFDPAMSTVRAR